jgi:general L-amino acid transport system permease protein
MAADDRAYVRTMLAASEPPPLMAGPLHALIHRLFSGPLNILFTAFSIVAIAFATIPLVRFLILDAVWQGTDASACQGASGACWPFVRVKLGQFIYGTYPEALRWRPDLAFVLGALLLAPLLTPSAPLKRINAFFFFGLYPIVAFVLLTGGNLDLRHFLISRLTAWDVFGQAATAGLSWNFWSDYAATALLIAVLVEVGAALLGAGARKAALAVLFVFAAVGTVILAADLDFGFEPVETRSWGGLLVTLVVAITGIVASLPLGILLALGRRSQMPLVRVASVIFIEFWRGVPLITVLFFATYMLPLFLPGGVSVDGLLRVLIGVALFSAAYMAEVVRGGLQAIPHSQYEAAEALGLGYWRTMSLVVLPQALTIVIPGIVGNFIGLFKDTTLVLIVAIFDLLGQLRAAFADPAWASPVTLYTGFAFAGIIYFVFCSGMSRYALLLERRAAVAERR